MVCPRSFSTPALLRQWIKQVRTWQLQMLLGSLLSEVLGTMHRLQLLTRGILYLACFCFWTSGHWNLSVEGGSKWRKHMVYIFTAPRLGNPYYGSSCACSCKR